MNSKNRFQQVMAAVLVCALCGAIVVFRGRGQAAAEPGTQRAAADSNAKTESATESVSATATPISDAAPVTGTQPTAAADAVSQLANSVVTIRQIDDRTGQTDPNFHSQTGVAVDPRGYIVTPLLDDKYLGSNDKLFTVHFPDHRDDDYVADVVENDRSWRLALLKVRRSKKYFPVISLDRIQELEFEFRGAAFVIPSRRKNPLKGRVTSDSANWGNSYPYTFIESNIKLPAEDGGSLLVSGRGDPIGMMSNLIVEKDVSYAVPLKALKRFVKSAINPDAAGALLEPGPPPVSRSPDLSDDEPMDSLREREPEPRSPELAETDDLDPSASHSPRSPAPATFTHPPAAAASRPVRAVTDSPAEQKLIEQLQSRESAAAELAIKIRTLQASSPGERNQPAIDDSQRELKHQLSMAFDLKLQLEELQVQELQSRLSRLERQIGQRRALRDKIIARRAAQLVEVDDNGLQWDTSGASPQPPPRSVSSERKTPTPAASPAVVKKLRRRVELLFDGMLAGEVKPAVVLAALQELVRIEPPPDIGWLEILRNFLEETRKLHRAGQITQADRLQIEAAFEQATSTNESPGLPPNAGNSLPAKARRDAEGWAGVTPVRLTGPKGTRFLTNGGHDEDLGTKPTFYITRQAGEVRQIPVQIQSVPGSQLPLRGRLDVYPTDSNDPEADAFLQNNALLFQIYGQDVRTVSGMVDVTKVAVMKFVTSLPGKKLEKIELETLDSSTFPPGTDMIEEASRHGAIVAVLSFSQRFVATDLETTTAYPPKPADGDSDTPTRVPDTKKDDSEP